jgi:hypothetical protein
VLEPVVCFQCRAPTQALKSACDAFDHTCVMLTMLRVACKVDLRCERLDRKGLGTCKAHRLLNFNVMSVCLLCSAPPPPTPPHCSLRYIL